MAFNKLLQLDLPDIFPTQEFSDYMSAARSVLSPTMTDLWKEFAGASNLIGWRFRSGYEDMTTYVESWLESRADVSFEELYLRERALFGMFTSVVSCIESNLLCVLCLSKPPGCSGVAVW